MCLILIAYRAHPDYPLVIAANRDEAYARPALPADFWKEHPAVYGGRDLEAGGTWLGITTTGRFAALTNYRQGTTRDPALRSRGELVSRFLCSDMRALDYVQAMQPHGDEYNGYSMLAGDLDALYFLSNRGNGVSSVAPGVHGLSNHLLDEPWPKVVKGTQALESWIGLPDIDLATRLFALLADRTTAPDAMLPATGIELQRERELSAAFIAAERYGTRACSVAIVRATGDVLFGERAFGPQGRLLYAKEERFRLSASRGAALPPRHAAG